MALYKRRGCGCCAYGCTMRFRTNDLSTIKMYNFPKDEPRRSAWINAVGRKDWVPSAHSRLCSLHFITRAPSTDVTHPDWKPTVFVHAKAAEKAMTQKWRRYERLQARRNELEQTPTERPAQATVANAEVCSSSSNAAPRSNGSAAETTQPNDLSHRGDASKPNRDMVFVKLAEPKCERALPFITSVVLHGPTNGAVAEDLAKTFVKVESDAVDGGSGSAVVPVTGWLSDIKEEPLSDVKEELLSDDDENDGPAARKRRVATS